MVEKLEALLDSYGLEHILYLHDIEPLYVLKLLIEEGMISWDDLEDLYNNP